MLCIRIWIPRKIQSILSPQKWRKNENLPPTACTQKFSGAFGAKFGPNLLRTSATFWTPRGWGVGGGWCWGLSLGAPRGWLTRRFTGCEDDGGLKEPPQGPPPVNQEFRSRGPHPFVPRKVPAESVPQNNAGVGGVECHRVRTPARRSVG